MPLWLASWASTKLTSAKSCNTSAPLPVLLCQGFPFSHHRLHWQEGHPPVRPPGVIWWPFTTCHHRLGKNRALRKREGFDLLRTRRYLQCGKRGPRWLGCRVNCLICLLAIMQMAPRVCSPQLPPPRVAFQLSVRQPRCPRKISNFSLFSSYWVAKDSFVNPMCFLFLLCLLRAWHAGHKESCTLLFDQQQISHFPDEQKSSVRSSQVQQIIS